MCFARTVTHYFGNDHSLGEDSEEGVVRRLHHAWPESELVLVDEAGHNASAPGVADAVVAATDKYTHR
ncbi:hypothetical protein [Streptomyces sp. NBC_01239]|uniref:hypothetical protein n=1 Tax=Streptomyces sp. NBC_01239 TaxID=2903792 RepID=UPI00338EC224